MMKRVNVFYVSRLFDPLFTLDDKNIKDYINLDEEYQVKSFLTKYIKDNFMKYGGQSSAVVKNTLQYLLLNNCKGCVFNDLFPEGCFQVHKPSDVCKFILWLWQVLFNDEAWSEGKLSDFHLQNNYSEPNSVYLK